VLNFDADILPEKNWRQKIENIIDPECLYGAPRDYDRSKDITENDAGSSNIWGYFQLWNVRNPVTWHRPVYQIDSGHAGNYDHNFMLQWPESKRQQLPIELNHLGEPRSNWFGHHPEAEKQMQDLRNLGLYYAWQTNAGAITIPPPKRRLCLKLSKSRDPKIVLDFLQRHSSSNPFEYTIRVGDRANPDETLVQL
jgi:hypothetical protein